MRWLGFRVLGVMLGLAAFSAPAMAQVAIPSSAELHQRASLVDLTPSDLAKRFHAKTASAARCSVQGQDWQCECLQLDGVEIGRWSRTQAGQVRAENVRLMDGSGLWFGQLALSGGQVDFGLMVWGDSEAVAARTGTLRVTEAILEGILGGPLSRIPAAVCEDGLPVASEGASVAASWKAAKAVGRGHEWAFTGFETGGVTLETVRTNQTKTGALPPVFRVARDTPAEIEAAYFWAPINTAILAIVAPGGWYGLGASYLSDKGQHALRAELRYDHEIGLDPYVEGEVLLNGGDRSRVSGRAEWPGSTEASKVRDLERGTLYRPWTLSEVGLDLSGDAYALGIRGGLVTAPGQDDLGRAGVRYGTTLRPREHLSVDLDVDQKTYLRGKERAHDAVAGVRIQFPFGQSGRWSLAPDLNTVMNFGVLPEEAGFEASTSGAVILGVESTFHFEGRFEGWSHRLRPGVRMQSEVFGFSQRTIPPAGSVGFPYARVPEWTALWLNLDQTFEFDGWSLGLPVHAFFSGEGISETFERPLGYAGLTLGAGGVYAEAAVVCGDLCDETALSGELHVDQDTWGVWESSTTAMTSALRVRQTWARRNASTTNWRLSTLESIESASSHTLGAWAQVRVVRLGAMGVWIPDSDGSSGASGTLSYVPPLLGWQWNAQIGATLAGEWNGSLNWSVSVD